MEDQTDVVQPKDEKVLWLDARVQVVQLARPADAKITPYNRRLRQLGAIGTVTSYALQLRGPAYFSVRHDDDGLERPYLPHELTVL